MIAVYSNGTLGQFSKRTDTTKSIVKRDSQALSSVFLDELNNAFNQTFNLSIPQIANPSIPNPFGGKENITLSDNSAAGQAVPFWTLIQPERKVDLM